MNHLKALGYFNLAAICLVKDFFPPPLGLFLLAVGSCYAFLVVKEQRANRPGLLPPFLRFRGRQAPRISQCRTTRHRRRCFEPPNWLAPSARECVWLYSTPRSLYATKRRLISLT